MLSTLILSVKGTAREGNLSPMHQKRTVNLNLTYFGPSLSLLNQSKSARVKEAKDKAINRVGSFVFTLHIHFFFTLNSMTFVFFLLFSESNIFYAGGLCLKVSLGYIF